MGKTLVECVELRVRGVGGTPAEGLLEGVELPATVTSVTVPPQFLARNTVYSLEVLAVEASGNQTLTEISFVAR